MDEHSCEWAPWCWHSWRNCHFLHLVSCVFFITLCIRLVYSHPLVLGVSHYICSQLLDPMEIHLFHCTHGGERMALRDPCVRCFCNHCCKRCEISHLAKMDPCLFAPYLISLQHQIIIVLLVDGVYTLANVVIIDPT
jgi:hypothetical protein